MKKLVSILAIVLLAALGCSDTPNTVTGPPNNTGQVIIHGTMVDVETGAETTIHLAIEYDSFEQVLSATRDDDAVYSLRTGPVRVSLSASNAFMQEVSVALESNLMNLNYRIRSNGMSAISGAINGVTEAGKQVSLAWNAQYQARRNAFVYNRIDDVYAAPGSVALLGRDGAITQNFRGTNLVMSVLRTQRLVDKDL